MFTTNEIQNLNEERPAAVAAAMDSMDSTDSPKASFIDAEQESLPYRPGSAPQDELEENQGDEAGLSQKLSQLAAEHERLKSRHRHLLEERDELSRQVASLRRQAAERQDAAPAHSSSEELKLLARLMDEERSLRELAKDALPSSGTLYARHDKFLEVFSKIVMRGN